MAPCGREANIKLAGAKYNVKCIFGREFEPAHSCVVRNQLDAQYYGKSEI